MSPTEYTTHLYIKKLQECIQQYELYAATERMGKNYLRAKEWMDKAERSRGYILRAQTKILT